MPDRQLFLKASVVSQYVGQLVERQLEPIGVPAYLLALLTHVRDHAPVTPSRVAEASGVPMTTLRDNVQRLVDRGLVRRVANDVDGRSYLLVLTPLGKRMVARAGDALLEAYLAVERKLPRSREDYERVFDEVTAALKAVLAEPTPAARGGTRRPAAARGSRP
jgi:DNA-binding MarR family transcriptional regulator